MLELSRFPGPPVFFQDFPVLGNVKIKFQDFPVFPVPGRTPSGGGGKGVGGKGVQQHLDGHAMLLQENIACSRRSVCRAKPDSKQRYTSGE